ncbi:hypothetical protein Mal52_30130 [Symmachiella dynata]|uniref:Uncharacterized protein n=2 Tax=Symmachiella dynata TaxID=2527995 RepID=A0A517ZQ10_9PLAN|nr:hypothetical protein Mal52_30130 [Symmachiella dynata]
MFLNRAQKHTPGPNVKIYVGRIPVDRPSGSGFRGWGIGNYSHISSLQRWTWAGEEIERETVFEISVSADLGADVEKSAILARKSN